MPQDDDVHRRPHQQIRTGSARKTARGPAEAQPPAPPLRARKQTGGGTRPNGEPSTPGVRRPGPSMITPNNQHRLADVSSSNSTRRVFKKTADRGPDVPRIGASRMTASNSHKRSVAKKHRSGAEFIDEDFIPQRRVTMNTSREKTINATTASVPLAYLDLDFNIAYDDDAHGDDEEPRMVVTPAVHSKDRPSGLALKRRIIMQTGRKSTKGKPDPVFIEILSDSDDDDEGRATMRATNSKNRVIQEILNYHVSPLGPNWAQSSLPFTRRAFRSGFRSFCRKRGIRVSPRDSPHKPGVLVVVLDSDCNEDGVPKGNDMGHRERFTEWNCPVCYYLSGAFETWYMLHFHFERDHSDWRIHFTPENEQEGCKLTIIVPERNLDDDTESPPPSSSSESESDDDDDDDVSKPKSTIASHTPEVISTDYHTPPEALPTPPPPEPAAVERPPPPVHKFNYYQPISHNGPAQGSSSNDQIPLFNTQAGASTTAPSTRADPFGPQAESYLSSGVPGERPLLYSCRVGGPQLPDLLGTLSMKAFGKYAPQIRDREEEMFDDESLRPENQVLNALWMRWMFSHRNGFKKDHLRGVLKFVEDNWQLIHKGAGWRALRNLLVGLGLHGYLESNEVSQLLARYETLTSMDPV